MAQKVNSCSNYIISALIDDVVRLYYSSWAARPGFTLSAWLAVWWLLDANLLTSMLAKTKTGLKVDVLSDIVAVWVSEHQRT
jgi:hypothetical protein